MTQLNGEEVLAPQDPPRLRYGAGILFPSARPLDDQEDDLEAVEAGSVVDEGDAASAPEGVTGETDTRADERGDGQTETDRELNRANEFLPSALGLTALIDLPANLEILIKAARYDKVVFPEEGYRNRKGEWVSTPYWFRRPIDKSIAINCSELLNEKSCVIERDIETGSSVSKLALHIYSRSTREIEVRGERSRFVTFTLINRTPGKERTPDEECFFQCSIEVRSDDRSPCFLEYPEKSADGLETSEELGLELLYRHKKVFAVGHGCAAEWESAGQKCSAVSSSALPVYDIPPILPAEIVGLEMNMLRLSDEAGEEPIKLCSSLADNYESWIKGQKTEALKPGSVPAHLKAAAEANLENCTICLRRIRRGIEILKDNRLARKAFSLMNSAMLMQQVHYSLSTEKKRKWQRAAGGLRLEAPFEKPDYTAANRVWRPFQIAFVLMSISSIVADKDEDLDERKIVDLIWFPTGGGKTEAYLGLCAFTIFWRRLLDPDNTGTTALMRYTLRLLTTQQYQRAASLICACEKLRREAPASLGVAPITIGLWVGGSVTPNSENQAQADLSKILRGDKENPFLILSCPWCGAQMGPVRDGTVFRAKGYRKLTNPNRVRLVCEDGDCDFRSGDGLPLQIVDEHIYKEPPTLLVATVDKFALLPWNPAARAIFGLGDKKVDPPDLIIQDELHLISGPLGSMVGHYETAIEALSRRTRDGQIIPAKIVASTATISRSAEQIKALYGGRHSSLFPPQGLVAGNSFFAEEQSKRVGRTYVGVFASGLPSQTTTEVRVLSTLLQAPLSFGGYHPADLDPYWTAMVYFNSIRELGHAATLLRADIPEYLSVIWRRLGFESRWNEEAGKRRRFINVDMELTSRVQNSEITEYMERLFTKYPKQNDALPVDVCLATNMIQVGLDVQRLSLMAIVGQPKTTSEYIQASSRVGRSGEGPGLVVTLLSPSKPRDRSHFEHFRAFHQSIYRYVEPTSVTPFAVPVTERALHALVVILARYWGSDQQRSFPEVPSSVLENRIRAEIRDRVSRVEPAEVVRVDALLDRIFGEWRKLPPERYGGFNSSTESVPFMYPSGSHPSESWDDRAYQTPSSMRNVDANCQAATISVFPNLAADIGESENAE
ncbi:helicase-related protein [Bradyrhizobium sp. CW1]|uniref:helicase-related protein n=1 Tax=Bradyrhizobium sp. CW1 TaxID=2782686 RepID=UPI001FFF26E2|nr:helicase-related protein [Bradyrhizobium sp. CW1]UPJ27799.1 hypothetical protein IVB54_01525 [Bradyrhizobium sp. CW1]